jgi:hypothetical protein
MVEMTTEQLGLFAPLTINTKGGGYDRKNGTDHHLRNAGL